MIQLTEDQILKQADQRKRMRGRTAVIKGPYYTNIEKDTKVYIQSYDPESELFTIYDSQGRERMGYCFPDELNLIDKEFSDYKIIKKGVRNERKDKYNDRFIIELLNNKRDIYLSTALSSLLNLNQDENYVGFATDPDSGNVYIFSTDSVSGYLFNKTNNRITSVADWRELNKMFESTLFEIIPQPIIDNNNPECIFYVVRSTVDYNNESVKKISNKNQIKVEKPKYHFGKDVEYEENPYNKPYPPPIDERVYKGTASTHTTWQSISDSLTTGMIFRNEDDKASRPGGLSDKEIDVENLKGYLTSKRYGPTTYV